MDRLTEDLVFDILSRLPIKPLMICRCVCKPWRNLARDPRFIHSHLTRSSSSSHQERNPSLILTSTISFDTISFHTQIHFVEHETPTEFTCTDLKFSIPNFQEFQIIGSCNGLVWLVHRFHKSSSFICNPFTRDHVQCPIRVSQPDAELNMFPMVRGFGFCSNSTEYKLVEIVYSRDDNISAIDLNSKVYVYTLGDSSWRFISNARYVIDGQFASKVVVNGAIHWISSVPNNLIVSFDFANEVFGVISHPQIDVGQAVCSLGVLDGCLLITDSSEKNRFDVWVMKDYGVEDSWVKCISIDSYNIGSHVRFISFMCLDKDEELLIVYRNQGLLSYNLKKLSLRRLSISGLPSWFEALNHVGSLVSPSVFFSNNR